MAPPYWWDDATLTEMVRNAGFFPGDPALLDRFAERVLSDLSYIDVLGSWLAGEERFREQLTGATTVRLRDLEPDYHDDPWSEGLRDRTVLVVHPFDETIRAQYAQREHLLVTRGFFRSSS